ncbi:hypothetical protein MMC12_001028 [Toensbergia leucococca]|nr:hypothetical protein [Toensbergia leucococca]
MRQNELISTALRAAKVNAQSPMMGSKSKLPLIDFGFFLRGSVDERVHVASAIDEALSSIGFIYLSNCGINQHKVDECLQWSKRFFALSESDKNNVRRSADRSHNRGFSGVGKEKLLDCLSLALNLSSDDSLARHHTGSLFNLSLIHYPALSTQLLRSGDLARIPAHSDFGTLTLLFQDATGGLEIAEPHSAITGTSADFEKSGVFRHIEPKPGTVVVNIGYLLMRWSNGRWKNTVHRVSEPPSPSKEQALGGFDSSRSQELSNVARSDTTPARYSIPFFAAPDPATMVEALPGCWSEHSPKRWKSINAGQYLRKKREATYV